MPTPATQLIMACHITGVYDVNRSQQLPPDTYALVSDWVDSVSRLKIRGVLFHNNLSDATCAARQNEFVRFVRVDYDTRFNPNVYRYFVYRDFLQTQTDVVDSLFVTDVSDVVVVSNPFVAPLFLADSNALFCGDEPAQLRNDWMLAHGTHLRERIADYADFEARFATDTLLNCGIIGGRLTVMQPFLEQLCRLHEQHSHDNKTAYTGDMGAFNYLVRTQFNGQLRHSAPVNTVFKGYQQERTDCWFRHK